MDALIFPNSSHLDDTKRDTAPPALWNPRAATYWGLLLTPAFSAYIHMRNWETLGNKPKAAETRMWFYTLMGYNLLCCVLSAISMIFDRDISPPGSLAFALIAVWHFWAGREQERHVGTSVGDSYVHRPWLKAVLCAAGIFVAATGVSIVIMMDFAR